MHKSALLKRLASLATAGGLALGMLLLPTAGAAVNCEPSALVQGEALTGDAYVTVAQAGTRRLCVQPATGAFYMEDSALGQTLYSNPPDLEEDTLASGYNLFSMSSAFILRYIDRKKVTNETNSTVASVRKNGLIVHRTTDGALLTYRCPDLGLTIPITCVLGGEGLEVSILVDQIREEGDYQLLECAFMPYLGSAGPADTGYLVLPDGSGALMEFSPDSARQSSFQYKKRVYGRDLMESVQSQVSRSEDIRLPVFGVKTAGKTVLGIVTAGDALSSIEVFAKGSKSLHTAVHPVLHYRGTFSRTLFDTSWEKKTAVIVAENAAAIERYTVRYTLMGEADYSAIAAATAAYYRQQTTAGGKGRDTAATLYLQVLGAVRRPTSVCGVPANPVYAATTYEEAVDILKRLKGAGTGGIHVLYQGMFAGGLYDKLPRKAGLEKALGGSSALASLQRAVRDLGGRLAPVADLSAIYVSGNGLSKQRDASRDFAGGSKEIRAFSPITYMEEVDGPSYTVLEPGKTASVYETFTAGLLKEGFDVFADGGIGRLASNNHRHFFGASRFADREEVKRTQQDAAADAAARLQGYMAAYASGYLFPYVTNVYDIPATSSRLDGFTREIPFYSLVASSFAQLAAAPLNGSSDETGYLLRCLEYGLLPSVTVSGKDTADLLETRANWLYAADAAAIVRTVAAIQETYRDALAIVGTEPLTAHERVRDGVYRSTYAGGHTLLINFTDAPVDVDGVTVPAVGYRITEQGGGAR